MYASKHLTFFAIEGVSFFILLSKNSGMLFSISSRVPFLCKTAAKNEITWEKKKKNQRFNYWVNVSRWTNFMAYMINYPISDNLSMYK